jgi:hypothetical protein
MAENRSANVQLRAQPNGKTIWVEMKTTRYFNEQVLRRRPYIKSEWVQTAILHPLQREREPDGRIRHWALILDTPDAKPRILRVVTLEDGETIHNASLIEAT